MIRAGAIALWLIVSVTGCGPRGGKAQATAPEADWPDAGLGRVADAGPAARAAP